MVSSDKEFFRTRATVRPWIAALPLVLGPLKPVKPHAIAISRHLSADWRHVVSIVGLSPEFSQGFPVQATVCFGSSNATWVAPPYAQRWVARPQSLGTCLRAAIVTSALLD